MKAFFCLLLLAAPAIAETNLAVSCPGAKDGAARADCPAVSYLKPTSSTLVREMTSNTWRSFGSLLPTDKIEVCATDVPAGSLSDPSTGAPCTRWTSMSIVELSTAAPVTGANTLELSWTPPTQNTDGSPVKLTGFRIYYGPSALTQTVTLMAPAATSFVLPNLPAGVISVAMTALGEEGVESSQSASVSGVTKAVKPNPPTGLKVLSDTNAYDIVKATNKLTLVSVGQIPSGTACSSSAATPAGFGIVDRLKVALTVKTRPTVVVARCG